MGMDRTGSNQPELLTRPRAARRAGVGLRQILAACASGDVPTYRIGGWPRVRWDEIQSWINAQRVTVVNHQDHLERESRVEET